MPFVTSIPIIKYYYDKTCDYIVCLCLYIVNMSGNPWDEDTILAISLGRPEDALSTLRSFGFTNVSR